MKTTSITGATHSLKPNGSEHTTVCTHDQLHTGQLAGYGLSLWSVLAIRLIWHAIVLKTLGQRYSLSRKLKLPPTFGQCQLAKQKAYRKTS